MSRTYTVETDSEILYQGDDRIKALDTADASGGPVRITSEGGEGEYVRTRGRSRVRSSLPAISLKVRGDTFHAEGDRPLPWRIYAEAETGTSARTRIYIRGEVVADVTIHLLPGSTLPEEVQEVAAALVWSALEAKKDEW